MSYDLTPDNEGPNVCSACRAPADVTSGYTLPLCATCRARLIAYPIPAWIKVAGALIGIVLLLALIRFPGQLRLARTVEREKRRQAQPGRPQAIIEKAIREAHETRLRGGDTVVLVQHLEALALLRDPSAIPEAQALLQTLRSRKLNRPERHRVQAAQALLQETADRQREAR